MAIIFKKDAIMKMINSDNFINGQWVKGNGEVRKIHSPHNGEVIGEVSFPDDDQIHQAIELAQKAQVLWGQKTHKQRAQLLFQVRTALLDNFDLISQVKSSESGKTLAEGKAGLAKGIEVLEFALSLQNLDSGSKMQVSQGVNCEYRREALGVVASITPFNFPAMVPLWTIPISLALGNAMVWKPSEKTPLTAQLIADAFKQAGLPAGLLTVLHGQEQTVQKIIENPHVKAVSFVGSTNIARKIYHMASLQDKRVLALGGAKNPIILLPDHNLELTAQAITDSFTGCAGQRCMAASLLLNVGQNQKTIQEIKACAQKIQLAEQMGAIISSEQLNFLQKAIDQAVAEGAELLLDGREAKAPKGMEKGNWIGPTILNKVNPASHAATTELFGPILSIIDCPDLSSALQIENNIPYGNACSVFTSNGAMAEKVAQNAKAGMVGVNVGVPVPREPFSFAGIADSKFGHGEITGEQSLDFWSNTKKVTTKWEKQTQSDWMS